MGDCTHCGMPRKNILELHKTYYGLFRGVAKGGKGRDQSGWKSWKIEGWGDKMG